MKRIPYLIFLAGSVLFVIVMAGFGGSELKNSSGAPAGNTNSPGDGQNCTHCMGGSAAPVTDWITSDVPASGYEVGTTYNITVTATGSGKKGFEVSPQDLSGNLIGTLTAGTGNKLVGSGKYVTHSASKSTNPATWTFKWTPPAGGAGDVTFYGAIAVTQTATKTTTLVIHQSTVGMSENRLIECSVFPNPVKDQVSVRFRIDSPGRVNIELFDLQGKSAGRLLSEEFAAGTFVRSFPVELPSGNYIVRLLHGESVSGTRMLVAR